MDFLSRNQPITPEEHVALLPEPLRMVVERELAAGNALLEAGGGFPAAPVGLWVKLARPFLTATRPPPQGAHFALRPCWSWPAQYTDSPSHNFVICAPGRVPTAPEPSQGQRPADAHFEPGQTPCAPDDLPETGLTVDLPHARPLHDRVSRAIELHLGLWFTPEIETAITAEGGGELLVMVREICSFAESPEFWMHGEHMANYHAVQARIREAYPFLSDAAVTRVATSAAYGWK